MPTILYADDEQEHRLMMQVIMKNEKITLLEAANGEDAIKAEITEWYVPTEEEMKLWRAGAIDAWLNAKGSFDPATAERVLEEQGLTDFIAALKKAGAL